jgi:hypothetical protein
MIASRNTTGQTGSSTRFCQARTSSSTPSAIALTCSGDSSVPYTWFRWWRMSRTVMPCAYRLMIMSSKPPEIRPALFGTSAGSNVPFRSRGTERCTGPTPV